MGETFHGTETNINDKPCNKVLMTEKNSLP